MSIEVVLFLFLYISLLYGIHVSWSCMCSLGNSIQGLFKEEWFLFLSMSWIHLNKKKILFSYISSNFLFSFSYLSSIILNSCPRIATLFYFLIVFFFLFLVGFVLDPSSLEKMIKN